MHARIDAQNAQDAHPLLEPFGKAWVRRTQDARERTNIYILSV